MKNSWAATEAAEFYGDILQRGLPENVTNFGVGAHIMRPLLPPVPKILLHEENIDETC